MPTGSRGEAPRLSARRTAYSAVLLCAALALSYAESLLPLPFAPPGVKPGLANIAVVYAAYTLGTGYAAAVSAGRVLLSALLFGSVPTLIFSAAGAFCAWAVTALLARFAGDRVTMIGASVGAAAAHSAAQTAAAAFLVGDGAVFSYLPVMLLASAVMGAVVGALASALPKLRTGGEK